ncbi:MAG TPA: dihydrolipoyllysine-residue acetyltransferase [Legionellaceae bacterium]|nr:dihydrolipoyllysine-residue acetyltransferase [Legionellaceae bacterium]
MEQKQNIVVPDIGGASGVDVIELLVKVGDHVEKETPLITLESDKATMEIPSPQAGIVSSMAMRVGDKVSEGDLILVLETSEMAEGNKISKELQSEAPVTQKETSSSVKSSESKTEIIEESVKTTVPSGIQSSSSDEHIAAGPAARRLARTLGIHLSDVQGSGRKDRISKEDVEAYVKQRLSQTGSNTSLTLPRGKSIDFTKFGDIETKPLSKIKRLTGINVHQAWISIPQVTQFDQADITDLEAFRKAEASRAEAEGYKLTIVAFVCKVLCQALIKFPQFNSSLDESGEQLIYKKYYHIGIAAETPNGLVVPVIKDVNQKSVADIARDLGHLSSKAREKGLSPAEMSGGCCTISSLGGIGGTAFTPIVNPPEVAILGLSRATIQPVYQNGQFVPRLILPLSLSYDHRVIDGAEAARFTRYLSEGLSDIRRILL